jgi:TolB protein
VQGIYTTDGREIHVIAKAFDVNSGAEVLYKKYPNALRVMRQTVHRMADDIIFQVAGEKGVCQTKIAFVSDMTRKTELYIGDYDGHNVFRMTRDEVCACFPYPQRNYITYTSYRRLNPDLWWVSSREKQRMLSFFPGLNTAASWSPDGERGPVNKQGQQCRDLYG